jgi:AraC-like DNA-binding protein
MRSESTPPHAPNPPDPPSFFTSTDGEFIASRCDDVNGRYIPLGREVRGEERVAQFSGFTVCEHAWDCDLIAEFDVSRRTSAIMLVTNNDGRASFSGERVEPGEILIFGPGSTHFTHGGRRSTLFLLLPDVEMERQLAALLGGEAPELDARRYRLRPSAPDSQSLRDALLTPWRHTTVASSPEDQATRGPWVEATLVSRVCEQVARSWTPSDLPESLSLRRSNFADARDLIRQARGMIDLTTLCERMGYSAESLRLMFGEFLGVPPMRYAKIERLHECRRRLAEADGSKRSVAWIASHLGFTTSLGRFAREYRELFGELPSETLRKGIARR